MQTHTHSFLFHNSKLSSFLSIKRTEVGENQSLSPASSGSSCPSEPTSSSIPRLSRNKYKGVMSRRNHIFPTICRPRTVILLALTFTWNLENGSNADNNHHHKHLRLRLPSSTSHLGPRLFDPFPGKKADLPFTNLRALDGDANPIIGLGNIVDAEGDVEDAAVLPTKRKKNCGGLPSIAARGALVGPLFKRSFFATTEDEMDEKMREEEETREKREISKRSETNEAPLPWSCETKYEWRDMGPDHYPRFVRTAECKTRSCFNGFFRCKPRRYKTKVLKRVSPSDSTSCEEDDVSLPEGLRAQWRFITVTISLCCDCGGRIPGTPET